jgi:hypothetical protein
MKKLYLTIITATLLIGIITAGITTLNLNKTITIKPLGIGNSESLISNFSYSEIEYDDGSIKVCVLKDKLNIGCRTINDKLLINQTETEIVENYINAVLKEQSQIKPKPINRIKGNITIVEK